MPMLDGAEEYFKNDPTTYNYLRNDDMTSH